MPRVPADPGSQDDRAPRPVVLDTPAQIVDAVPYLVGFQPAESVVALSLRGQRGRVGLTARADLPPPEWADECAAQLVGHLRRDGARRVVVVAYPPAPGLAHPSVRAIADAFTHRLAAIGIPLAELLCVHEGKWWSLVCDDPACCPNDGTPVAASAAGSVLGAAMAVEGRVVLPSRAALAATLEPLDDDLGAAMARALPEVQAAVGDRVWGGHRDEVAAESLALFTDAVRRRVEGHTGDPPDVSARLIVGLDDLVVRDVVITWTEGERGAAARALLAELVPRAVPPFHVVPLTVLGWLAYQSGEGALAAMAVERALAADPDYALALLLAQALDRAIDPAVFRMGLRSVAERWAPVSKGKRANGGAARSSGGPLELPGSGARPQRAGGEAPAGERGAGASRSGRGRGRP